MTTATATATATAAVPTTTMPESYGCRLRAIVYNGRAHRAVKRGEFSCSKALVCNKVLVDRHSRRRTSRPTNRTNERDCEHVPRRHEDPRLSEGRRCASMRRARAAKLSRASSFLVTPRHDHKEGINNDTHRRPLNAPRSRCRCRPDRLSAPLMPVSPLMRAVPFLTDKQSEVLPYAVCANIGLTVALFVRASMCVGKPPSRLNVIIVSSVVLSRKLARQSSSLHCR